MQLWRVMLRHAGLLQGVLLLVAFTNMPALTSADGVVRFEPRKLDISSNIPGATNVTYTVSLTYTTATTIGSLDMEFCMDPIPYDPCVAPAGLDVSGVNTANTTQTGETYDTVTAVSSNHILLRRSTPAPVGNTPSTYMFTGITNPTDTSHSFAVRLSDFDNTTGPNLAPDGSVTLNAPGTVDVGSALSQVGDGILIETQVPPIMIFCINHTVAPDCSTSDGDAYTNLGTLDPTKPLTTTAQMAVETNAFNGYSVSVYGTTMTAGTHAIDPLATPTVSAPGNNQFGLNLRANTSPNLGADPDGPGSAAVISPAYDVPNEFAYNDGDVLVSAPGVSIGKRFTISYIVNSSPNIRAGVYTTTLTYFAIGNF